MQAKLKVPGQAVISSLCIWMLLTGVSVVHVAGQGATATILGTVTDTSGAAIPDANVQVRNVGTDQIQTTQSDPQGRFRVPDVPIGDYEVQSSKDGFATVIHKGITLAVGSQNVVDFSLAVGQTQQTVTVEGEVTQVETTNAAVGSLVNQAQMRELPLNGRNFEQLIQLAPGVQNYYAGSEPVGTATGTNAREGRDPAISIAGSRPEGFALLMDDQSLETFFNRGLASITGTSLGVDAIAEFQMLTNTYGAQFGGSGAVMNSASKSGTNSFHGSVFEFLRNSDLDARNFNDGPSVPEFRRNQYGGTFGGPVKKDKVFFFANYEGIRYLQGVSATVTVPLTRTSTATSPTVAAEVNAALALYPQPTFNINTAAGTGQTTVVKDNTANENYALGRMDYTISEKDSFFARYFIDRQNALYPYSGSPLGLWGESDLGINQFITMEERHIFSPTMVNTLRASFSRTDFTAAATNSYAALQFFPGQGRADGSITIGGGLTGLNNLGTSASPMPESQIENRFSEGDDLAWTVGAHSFRFGGSIDRIQPSNLWPFQAGSSWTFSSLPLFLAGTALSVAGTMNNPDNNVRAFRELDFAVYAQDDWKVTPKLTLNLGLRYQPTTNPVEVHNLLSAITNFATATSFSSVPNAFQSNPSLTNWDPRFGFAYDLFADHKTSIRGGFGTFHDVVFPGEYVVAFNNSPPLNQITQLSPSFPVPFTGPTSPNITLSNGNDWHADKTPYLIEYNLNVQREISSGTVLSVGYVGSHGVNNFSEQEQNPDPATIVSGVYVFSPTCGATNSIGGPKTCATGVSGRNNGALGSFPIGENGSTSHYNSLQASLNRRLTRSVQAQVSYTYSKCMSDGDSALGSLSGNAPTVYENPYQRSYDYSVCAFNATQALRVNTLVDLPFHANRFVEGWQLSGILAASTGLPFNVSEGVDQGNQIAGGAARPNYAPNNPAAILGGVSYPACNNSPIIGTANLWFNPNCFTQEAFGTLGNFGREGLIGPGLVNLDLGILKTTKLRENMTLQFRAELFNLFNHVNLSLPVSTVFSGTPSATTTLGHVSNSGQILGPASPSREVQFGLKLLF
jgi:hypothetical protein